MKDGEGINQRTFMHNPWTRTTIWGLAWDGEMVGMGVSGEREKSGNNSDSINNTKKIQKNEQKRNRKSIYYFNLKYSCCFLKYVSWWFLDIHFSFFFIVVQGQLSPFSPTSPYPSHPHLPPSILPSFGFVQVSFIHVPDNTSPFPPIIPSHLPSGYCQFVLNFKVCSHL